MSFKKKLKFSGAVSILSLTLISCSTNPNKAKELETKTEKSEAVSARESVGVNADGMMIYQRKVRLSEEVRKLQDEVFDLEDRVWGTRKYKTLGLNGDYSNCRNKISADKKSLFPAPDKPDRLSDKDEEIKAGVDTNRDKLALVTEEKIVDRIKRFQSYRQQLQTKEDELNERLSACKANLL